MANTLMERFGETCYMSCSLLGYKTSIKAQYTAVFDLLSFEIIFRYSLIVLIGFSALFVLIYNTKLKDQLFFLDSQIFKLVNSKNLFLTFIILLLPSLMLAASMTDWGRVVNMAYTFSILTYIYLIKNELIVVKERILIFDNFYIYRKKFFILLLIIFAFWWNPKTGMTGDIGTNSLYKIIYNTSKKIFKFGSVRLFQDSPIIKFHKKYIE
tara:strand:+ start:205 stop:837 length:633 start_codon:yes stop_codon:yes gene_type:complete